MKNIAILIVCTGLLACKPERQKEKPVENTASSSLALLNEALNGPTYILNPSRNDVLALQAEEAYRNAEAKTPELLMTYLTELFKSGEYAKSAQYSKELFPNGVVSFDNLNKNTRAIFELLGDGYLMVGLQQNNSTIIYPVSKNQAQEKEEYTEAAIEFYSRLRKAFPENRDYLWKLNLCHMLLGTYPGSLPIEDQLLLNPLGQFTSPSTFYNLSGEMGIRHQSIGGASVLLDIDNDKDLDVFTCSHHMEDQALIYEYDNYKYKEVQNNIGLKDLPGGSRVSTIDYNNDGFDDLFIARGALQGITGQLPNTLLKGSASGKFEDVAAEVGITSKYPTENISWSDVDLDGDVDFYSNNSKTGLYIPGELFYNNGNSFSGSLDKVFGPMNAINASASTFADIDGDRWPDLIVLNSEGRNHVFLNKKGRFEASSKHSIERFENGSCVLSFDFDNDGDLDLLITGKGSKDLLASEDFTKSINENSGVFTQLFINDGSGRFSPFTNMGGLERVNYVNAASYIDINNDGFLDIYLSTGGFINDDIVPNRLFINDKGLGLKEVSTSSRTACISKTYGIAVGDLDGDGDSDLYLNGGGFYSGDLGTDVYFNNRYQGDNRWVSLALKGNKNNRQGIGAVIKIEGLDKEGNSKQVFRHISNGDGPFTVDVQTPIGLGDMQVIKKLEVRWPLGHVQRFSDLAVNQKYLVEEGKKEISTL